MVLHAELEFSSSGCNRTVGNLCCGTNDIYAYGSHNAVVLYDTKRNGVVMTLLGHQDVVTSVAWMSDVDTESMEQYLVSGSADGSIIFWKVNLGIDQNSACPWEILETFGCHHKGPVTCVAVDVPLGVVITTGGDGCVTVMSSGSDSVGHCEHQRLSFGTKLVHCASITHVDEGAMLLALGFVDGSVQVFASSGDEVNFTLACNLSGHQNWIRGIDFAHVQGGRILLATGSQDRYVRVWSIEKSKPDQSMSLDSLGITKYAPKPRVYVGGISYDIILESLLVGHEDWVMSVAWNTSRSNPMPLTDLTLLSSSMDRTMILWKKDIASGIWLSSEVVGDAGINHLGYYTCMWGISGSSIATHGYTGALHIWDRCGEGVEETLRPRTSNSGHMSEVVDSSWSHDGSFLLTVSSDQTARIFSSCKSDHTVEDIWCEIARPQIHGHDFSCVSMLKSDGGIYRYTSGSEEKVLRIFESPVTFLDTLLVAQGHDVEIRQPGNALGAKLPALGLSNKAIIEDAAEETERVDGSGMGPEGYDDGADLAPTSAPSVVTCPPLEEHLSQNTLWPETNKLYGHGNDIFCVASDPKGRFLASASRAQSASTAGIIIWDASSWTQICTLDGHTLTVTCLEFSPCGDFLASVGRDRKLCVYKTHSTGFSRVCTIKAHSRVLWGVSWSPDSKYLFTSSRDLTIKCWRVEGNGSIQDTPVASITCTSSPRTIASVATTNSVLLAAGLEQGGVDIFDVRSGGEDSALSIHPACAVPAWLKHAAAVRRVLWRPSNQGQMTLSSVGEDYSVKVWTIKHTTG